LQDDIHGINFVELKTRPCLDSDFFSGEDDDEYKPGQFFKINKNAYDLFHYTNKLKCIDEDIFAIQGSYNSYKASNLMVVFERCDKQTQHTHQCHDSQEIDDWLEFKFLVTLENEQRFIANQFDGQRVSNTSKVNWHALTPKARVDYVKMV